MATTADNIIAFADEVRGGPDAQAAPLIHDGDHWLLPVITR